MFLVGHYDSPFVRRVGASLHFLGIPFQRTVLSVFTDANEMARLNPLIRVPSLILDDGEIIIDSAAILDYLDELAGPDKALIPAKGPIRREVLRICAFATGVMDKTVAHVYEQRNHAQSAVNAEWLARCDGQIHSGLSELECRLTGDWFAAGRMTQGDITAAAMIGYILLRMPEKFPTGDFPKLNSLYTRLSATQAFQDTKPSLAELKPR
jgi:glutathione S-transferase